MGREFSNLAATSGRSAYHNVAMASDPPIRRMKTYTGGQGYVYQYYFVGQRPAQQGSAATTEYVFDVTSDRKTTYSVSVFVEQQALRAWSQSHGRSPSDAE